MRTIAHWVDGKYYEGNPIGRFAVENPGTGEVEAELLQASDADLDHAVEVARRVHAAGARVYALQQARSEGTSGEFDVVAPGWDGMCERMAERIEALGWDRFNYRPA